MNCALKQWVLHKHLKNCSGLPKVRVILNPFTFISSIYSSVGVVTCLWRRQLRDLEQVLGKGKRFTYLRNVQVDLRTNPHTFVPWSNGALTPAGTVTGREADDWTTPRVEMELQIQHMASRRLQGHLYPYPQPNHHTCQLPLDTCTRPTYHHPIILH
jgi:hypothetical protein